MEGWHGRIDSLDDPEALRWHQLVRPLGESCPAGIALLGFASDEGVRRNSGRVGSAEGPASLRRALANLPALHSRPLYDAGDVACDDGDLEHAQRRFGELVGAVLAAGHFPIGLGGGHEIGFATYLGLAAHLPHRRIAIVNLDAHFDLRDGEVATSGTPFRQALRHADEHGLALDYICLGASRSANTPRLFRTAAETGTKYILDEELTTATLTDSLARLQEWLAPSDAVYLSLCLDVLPSGVAPGVSAPSARGVPLEVIEPILATIVATGKLRACDVAELSPPWDRDGATARVAARLIHRLAA